MQKEVWPPAPTYEAPTHISQQIVQKHQFALMSFLTSVCGTLLFLGPLKASRLLLDNGRLTQFYENLFTITGVTGLLALVASLVGGLLVMRTWLGKAALGLAGSVLVWWAYTRFVCHVVF